MLLLAAGWVAKAADPEPLKLTLHDAVEMALKQNPQVQIANLNIAESLENQNVARSGLLPQVNLDASQAVRRANLQALFGSAVPGFPGTHRALLGDASRTVRIGADLRFDGLAALASI